MDTTISVLLYLDNLRKYIDTDTFVQKKKPALVGFEPTCLMTLPSTSASCYNAINVFTRTSTDCNKNSHAC